MKANAQTKDSVVAVSAKTIAILPARFKFIVPYDSRINLTAEQKKEVELRTGFAIQTGVYDWYLKNAKKKKLAAQVQDIKVTNNTLFADGMSFDQYLQLSEDSLLKILHTDAIWFCTSESSKIVSGGDEGFLGALSFGSIPGFMIGGLLSAAKPSSVTALQMGIKETGGANAVWTRAYQPLPNDTWGVDKALNRLLSLIPETFPYKKKK